MKVAVKNVLAPLAAEAKSKPGRVLTSQATAPAPQTQPLAPSFVQLPETNRTPEPGADLLEDG